MKEQIRDILNRYDSDIHMTHDQAATALLILFNREHEIIMDKNKVLMEMVDRQWRRVDEKPSRSGEYIAYDPNYPNNPVGVLSYRAYNNIWINDVADEFHPTHWQPLPTPPISTPSQNKL